MRAASCTFRGLQRSARHTIWFACRKCLIERKGQKGVGWLIQSEPWNHFPLKSSAWGHRMNGMSELTSCWIRNRTANFLPEPTLEWRIRAAIPFDWWYLGVRIVPSGRALRRFLTHTARFQTIMRLAPHDCLITTSVGIPQISHSGIGCRSIRFVRDFALPMDVVVRQQSFFVNLDPPPWTVGP